MVYGLYLNKLKLKKRKDCFTKAECSTVLNITKNDKLAIVFSTKKIDHAFDKEWSVRTQWIEEKTLIN